MTRRRRLVDEPELDYAPPPRLVVVDELAPSAALEARLTPPELPPREPVPLDALEAAWSNPELPFLEAYVARSITLAGGFRPTLERAFGMR